MTKKLTILFVPLPGVGHVNPCIGLAEVLRDRGHKIIFVINNIWSEKLSKYEFIEELVSDPNAENFKNSSEVVVKQMLEFGILSKCSSIEKVERMANQPFFKELPKRLRHKEPELKAIIEKHKPDIYIIDDFIGSPSVIYSDRPWVYLYSGNPLFVLDDERTPPGFSGYPSNGDKNEWKEFRIKLEKLCEIPRNEYNKWLSEIRCPQIETNRCIPHSPYLNIYGYPEELDYTDIRPLPEKWFRIDSFMRRGEEEFKLPEKLSKSDNNSSKLIYLSLGSLGSFDINLIKKLIAILAKTPHKFIVSKGPFHEKYELADNMWGQRSVPQTKVLPLVDLVITHGGNNSITETFSFGKPMIVMPLFGDQFDNAQRIHEKGFGIRLDGYNCTESELINAIEKLLNDKELKERLTVASNRILNSKSLIKAAELIEKLV